MNYARISHNGRKGPSWALVAILPPTNIPEHRCRAIAGFHIVHLPATQYQGPWEDVFNREGTAVSSGTAQHLHSGPLLTFSELQWERLAVQPVAPDELPQYLGSPVTTDDLFRAIKGEPFTPRGL